MADVRAVKNGNWSDTTVWNTGALPTTADDVFSNTFTVNVDTSFQVLSLRNTSGTGITAGGTFNFNSGSISGSCTSPTGTVQGAINLITITANAGTVTISAPNTTISPASATATYQLINYTGGCDLIITASSFVAGSQNINNIYCINKTSNGSITLVGNLSGNTSISNTNNSAALISTGGNTIIRGNIAGALNPNSNNNEGIRQTGGNLIITGSVTGGATNSTNYGVNFSGTAISISGSVIGGAAAVGLLIGSAAIINIVGPITPSASQPAISSATAHTLTYSGSLTSANNVPAIISSNASATNIFTGPFINTNNTMAVQCVDMVLTADASTSWNFGDITLFSPERLAYYPSASDIRQGTTYADGTVSGSLAMPPATAVIAGTPTDNTTGSAVLTPTQLQDAVWGRDLSQMTETGSIGNRLARASTTGTTGAQIASYLL